MITIFDGFGYTGGQFKLIYEDVIGYLQGSNSYFLIYSKDALCLWNLESNRKEYIPSSRNGFQSFCANFKRRLIALAEYGLNPQVFIHEYPSKNQVMVLEGVSDLEIVMMDFSYDGKYLLVVTGVPNYQISIWELETGKKLQGEHSELPQKLNFKTAQFSFSSSSRLIIQYQRNFLLYELVPSYEKENDQVVKKIKLELSGQFPLNAQNEFYVWDYLSEFDTGDQKDQTNLYLIQDKNLIYLSGTNLHEITRYSSTETIRHLITTQKHLILIYESGSMEWLFKYIPVNINDQTLLPFKLDKQYKSLKGDKKITQVLYNHHFTKLFIGLSDASLIILNVPAEAALEDEDEGDQAKEKQDEELDEGQIRQVDADSVKLGPYQTGSVTFIREFKTVNVLINGCSTGKLVFWDILRRDVLTNLNVKGSITSGEISSNDQLLIIGSSLGVIRLLNIANIKKPVLVKMIKVFKGKPVSQIIINPAQDTIAVSSEKSKKIYFLNMKYMSIIGYVNLPVRCSNIIWNNTGKQLNNVNTPMVFAITNFLLIGIVTPDPNQQYDSLKLDRDVCMTYARKIDPDQYLIAINPNGDIITTGRDKVFKKYKQPEEQLSKIDLKIKLASQGPMDEQDGHQLPATCMTISSKYNQLCSCAEDGSIMLRSYDRLNNDISITKGHSLKSGGVSALEVSSKYKMIYTGGFDGSIFWWTSEKITKTESDADKVMRTQFDVPMAVDDYPDIDVKHYQFVLEEEYIQSQAPIREQQKKEKKDVLLAIKEKLDKLIKANQESEELEKLSRDDFVIDIAVRDEIINEGQQQCMQLREQVKRENYRQEILYKLIKERTWDQMEVALKGINGLNSNILVTNFHIRLRGPDEMRRLQLVKELRRQELKEKLQRKERKQTEVWQIEELIQDPRAYIVNAIPGQPTLVLTDYEKKEEQNQGGTTTKGQPGSKTGTGAKPAPGRGGPPAKGGKAVDVKKQQEEEREKEEKEKEEKEKEKTVVRQEDKKEGEEFGEWDYIYGSFELFSNNRKRNQMILLNNIIFSIKKEYNVEFEKMMQVRATEVENIHERNKRITEVLNELKKPIDLFESKKNMLENPESVLTVNNEEIPFERYLSKDERERREIERKKEEERIAALMKDDSGIRAIKDMMGGTLEEKKETPLDEKLEVEEWMSKPQEEMTEEERNKLKEFEVKKQRLEEEKEKIRKNLESELKKLRNEILDICYRFDERLLMLFRRKLEYDYRIYEQELCIIRLALSIIMQDQGNVKIGELKSLIQQLQVKEQQAQDMQDDLETLRKETEAQRQKYLEQMNQAYAFKQQQHGFDAGKIKNIWLYAFEEVKKDEKKQKELDKKLIGDPIYKDNLIVIDPLFDFEKNEVKKERDQYFDNFTKDIQEKIQNLQLFDWNDSGARDFTIGALQNRFNLKKDFEKLDSELNDLKSYCQFYQNSLQQIGHNLETSKHDHDDIDTMMKKSKSNIELLVRFKQGFVEITSDKPVANLTEAVLIPRKLIDDKNREIQGQGDQKIKLMEDIKKIKFDVAQSEYQLKRRELIIKDLECKTREVQLLKVKKEMQVALTRKDTRLNDQELKNLQDQIDMLKQATEKRILIYQKKEEKIKKDIEFIQKENEQLLAQGANLNVSVKQLQEISDMTFKKNAKQTKEGNEELGDNQAYDKFRQIAVNRKYFDLAKKQTEEIELLREELNKLKARTFANFANVSR